MYSNHHTNTLPKQSIVICNHIANHTHIYSLTCSSYITTTITISCSYQILQPLPKYQCLWTKYALHKMLAYVLCVGIVLDALPSYSITFKIMLT